MNTNPCTLTTGEVRFSYLHVFQPYAQQQGAEPKYSVTLLIPKTDVATKGLIDAAINAATNNGVSSKWNGIRPPQLFICVHDGDGGRPSDGMPFGDECKGHWVVTASNKNAPFVVDANVQPILQRYVRPRKHHALSVFQQRQKGRRLRAERHPEASRRRGTERPRERGGCVRHTRARHACIRRGAAAGPGLRPAAAGTGLSGLRSAACRRTRRLPAAARGAADRPHHRPACVRGGRTVCTISTLT